MQVIEEDMSGTRAAGRLVQDGAEGSVLDLVDVTKLYGSAAVVNRVNLSVRAGELLVLLGPSGSGKTTLLNLIAGFVDSDGGEIRLAGRKISELPPYRRDIGVVFQSYALFPHMNVAKNVAFPLTMRRIDKREITKLVDEAIGLVGLDGYQDRMPRQLSGGEQQRVALARALVFKPRLLLMDEPMSALDRRLRERLQQELKRLQKTLKLTVCYVTHDQDEAFTLADRIGVMHKGELAQIGTPADLYDQPSDSFVARFVGDTNLLNGTISSRDGDLTFTSGGLSVAVTDEMCGQKIETDASERDAMLTVRPHRIVIGPSGTPLGEPDSYVSTSGTVVACDYLGAELRLVIHADAIESDLLCRGDARLKGKVGIGDAVEVGWQNSDAVVLFE